MNIAVFVSGNGSNLQALIDAEKKKKLAGAKIKLVVCDNAKAFALARAKRAKIRTFVLEKTGFDTREEYDQVVAEELAKEKIDLVVLAGFMRILSGYLVKKYSGRMINIHPSLLPAFKGAHGIKDAYEYGVKITGVTVHFVTEDLDAGPVIMQGAVDIKEGESLAFIEKRIHKLEHRLYPEAVRLFAKGRIKITGNKAKVIKKK